MPLIAALLPIAADGAHHVANAVNQPALLAALPKARAVAPRDPVGKPVLSRPITDGPTVATTMPGRMPVTGWEGALNRFVIPAKAGISGDEARPNLTRSQLSLG